MLCSLIPKSLSFLIISDLTIIENNLVFISSISKSDSSSTLSFILFNISSFLYPPGVELDFPKDIYTHIITFTSIF